MISSWLAYIVNLLPLAIRQSRVVQLMSVLLSPAKTSTDELNTYVADARLRSAATWQVIWLEKLLSDALGYPITITEGTGLPIDFNVSGISYADQTLARGLLNRYKLAGKSYVLTFADITLTGQWLNPVCARTTDITLTGQWLNPVCAQELQETVTFTIHLLWRSGNHAPTSGITGDIRISESGSPVEQSHSVTPYTKGETLAITLPKISQGYFVKLGHLDANIEGGSVMTELVWSLHEDMSNPQSSLETHVLFDDETIFVEIHPAIVH